MTTAKAGSTAKPGGGAVSSRSIRAEFPILQRTVGGRPLAYLDSAASTQKPRQVIEAESRFYGNTYANIHRGVHRLSQEATVEYERAREKVRAFIGARDAKEIVFNRGTTESINLVAWSWGRSNVGEGDEIVLTQMEHHSNIVPWQMLCEATGAKIRVVPVDDAGELDLDAYRGLLGSRTKLVGVVHVSNALGTVNPVREMAGLAHAHGAKILVDGAQGVVHGRVDVTELDCDFYAFSGHKLYAPTGIGALYAREEILETMPPYQGGGDMILSVRFEGTTYNDIPWRFEAGTPNIAGAVGLGAAIDWLEGIGMDVVDAYEQGLLRYATAGLSEIPEVRILGTARHKAGVISFIVEGVHAHDVGTILDHEGIAIRAGHHCTQPLMERFGVPATARVSFAAYNTLEEIDRLILGVRKVVEMFR